MKWLLLLFFASSLSAEAITGVVVKVYDGDTVTVQDDEGKSHSIRFLHIDAPEKGQEFGPESTEALRSKIGGKEVVVQYEEYEVYHRILGDVYYDNRWINREMVSEGWAWQNRQYSKMLIPEESDAKAHKRGVWSRSLIPSWIWRLDQKLISMKRQRDKLMKEWIVQAH